jgi:hypothetical protein
MLWVRISIRARCTTLCDKFSSTNKTDRHDITEILLNTIKQTIFLFVLSILCEPEFLLRLPLIFFFNLRHNPYFLFATITIISTITRITELIIVLKNKQMMVFNNISVISWRSVLLVEENLSHNVVHLTLIEIQTDNISGDRHWLHS